MNNFRRNTHHERWATECHRDVEKPWVKFFKKKMLQIRFIINLFHRINMKSVLNLLPNTDLRIL
jgi:hypothetical protein